MRICQSASYYATGSGEDASLAVAKRRSYDQAIHRLTEQVRNVDKEWAARPVASSRVAVLAAAEVVNTSFGFDETSRRYRRLE